MWKKLKNAHPWLYESIEWGVLALAVGSFFLALEVYLR